MDSTQLSRQQLDALTLRLAPALQYLQRLDASQPAALANWAAKVLGRGWLSMRDLEKCFKLGF